MTIANQANFFLDFQGFSDLKRQARGGTSEASRAVAQQFEGLLVQQMLAAMRAAVEVDAGGQSSYLSYYRELYDKQLAQVIAGQDHLGVAKMILQQIPHGDAKADAELNPKAAPAPTATPVAGDAEQRLAAKVVISPAATPVVNDTEQRRAAEVVISPAVQVRVNKVLDNDFAEVAQIEQFNRRWHQPQQFIADIWPAAQQVAPRLGVSAELLVAQAALETGWGRHTMKFDDGRSSFNLFGIKAGAGWPGSALSRTSLEYRNGVWSNQVSRFRAYDSPAHSLADYVEFIGNNPRYRHAKAQAADEIAYLHEIQRAGYATDPNYADKVIGVLQGDQLQNTLANLDSGGNHA